MEDSLTKSFNALALELDSSSSSSRNFLLFLQCSAVLRASLVHLSETVEEPLPSPENPLTTQQLELLSASLSHQMTKFVLFLSTCSSVDEPQPSMFIPLAEELSKQTTAIICALRGILSKAQRTLKIAVIAAAHKILSAILADVEQIERLVVAAERSPTPSKEKFSTKEIGLVIEALKALASLPLTNTQAVGRLVNSHLNLLKDSRAQLSQIKKVEEKEEKLATGEDDEDFDDEDFDDEDFDDFAENEFSPSEFLVVPPCLDLLAIAFFLTRRLYAFILKLKISDERENAAEENPLTWLERQGENTEKLTRLIDDLGSAIFPPQKEEKIKQEFKNIIQQCFFILQEFFVMAQMEFKAAEASGQGENSSVFIALLEENEKSWEEKDEILMKTIENQQSPVLQEAIKQLSLSSSAAPISPSLSLVRRWQMKYFLKLSEVWQKIQ